jgi:ribosomal-protein-alanine N-acetyltransferase
MTRCEIGPIDSIHVEEILEIEKTLFATPWTRGMFEQEIAARPGPEGPGTYSVVATADGRVAGYAVAWFIDDGVHLMNIAVRREFQRQGIGRRLMDDLVESASAAGKRFIVLEVRRSNAAAQAFYREFFFRKIGVRRHYYADNGEDAVLMALDLLDPARRRPRRHTGPGERETGKRETD